MSRTQSVAEKRDYDERLDVLLDQVIALKAQHKLDQAEISYFRAMYGAVLLEASGRDVKNPFAR